MSSTNWNHEQYSYLNPLPNATAKSPTRALGASASTQFPAPPASAQVVRRVSEPWADPPAPPQAGARHFESRLLRSVLGMVRHFREAPSEELSQLCRGIHVDRRSDLIEGLNKTERKNFGSVCGSRPIKSNCCCAKRGAYGARVAHDFGYLFASYGESLHACAALASFLTSYPVNWGPVTAGIEEKM
jgi:hypothetical protein